MKLRFLLLTLVVLLPLSANAHFYRKGTIVRMSVVSCMGAEHKGIMDVIGGGMTGGGGPEGLCREFTLKSDKVVYRIRTRKEVLLPLGEDVDFRLARKDLVIKQDDEPDELKFTVLSMKLISEADEADQRAVRLFSNHCIDAHGKITVCKTNTESASLADEDEDEE